MGIPKILLVEDDTISLTIVKQLLIMEGYEVEAATSGREAMHILSRGEANLAIVDLMLPDTSGLELLNEHLAKEFQRIPVIVISSLNVYDVQYYSEYLLPLVDIIECAVAYFTKPFSGAELVRTVNRELSYNELIET